LGLGVPEQKDALVQRSGKWPTGSRLGPGSCGVTGCVSDRQGLTGGNFLRPRVPQAGFARKARFSIVYATSVSSGLAANFDETGMSWADLRRFGLLCTRLVQVSSILFRCGTDIEEQARQPLLSHYRPIDHVTLDEKLLAGGSANFLDRQGLLGRAVSSSKKARHFLEGFCLLANLGNLGPLRICGVDNRDSVSSLLSAWGNWSRFLTISWPGCSLSHREQSADCSTETGAAFLGRGFGSIALGSRLVRSFGPAQFRGGRFCQGRWPPWYGTFLPCTRQLPPGSATSAVA